MVFIDERYNGPPGSANGGYASGVIAAALPPGNGIPEVTLRSPPPLGRELAVQSRGDGIAVLDGDVLVAEARRVPADLEHVDAVPFESAVAASDASPIHDRHPYPGCFVCGPERDARDGLRIIPGPVDDRKVVASPWIPDATVADGDGVVHPAVVWSALDCPSWFAYSCFEPVDGLMLLGRLTADILRTPPRRRPPRERRLVHGARRPEGAQRCRPPRRRWNPAGA